TSFITTSSLSLHDALPIYLKLREQRPNPRRIGRKAVREYFLDCEARNLSEQTLWWYREKLGRFLQFLENQGVESVESITPSVIRDRKSTRLNSSHVKTSYA